MMRKLCVAMLGVMLSVCATAQVIYSLGEDSTYVQRLKKEAESASDSARAYGYLKIALHYKRANAVGQAQKYLLQATELGKGSAFLNAATAYYKTMIEYKANDMVALEKDLRRADSLLTPFSQPEADKLRAMLWNSLGTLQQIKGSEAEAMDAFTNKAATFALRSGDAMVLAKTHKSIAIVFMNANQREKAASYLKQSIAALEKAPTDNPVNVVERVETYIIAGENYLFLQEYDSAKIDLDKAAHFLEPHPTSNLYLIYYFAEGSYFDKRGNYALANRSFDAGIAMAKALGAERSLNRLLFVKYKTLSHQKDYRKAAAVLSDLLKSPLVFTTDKRIYYQEMYTTYANLGDTREAFRWAEKYIDLSDSLYASEFQNDIVELEKKYKDAESQKKIAVLHAEKEKTELESRNTKLANGLLGAFSLFLSVTFVFAFVLYRNSKKLSAQKEMHYQQQLKEAEQKQQIQVTRALMQGEEKERKRLAIDLHDGLGSRLAGVKISLSQLVSINSAIDHDLLRVIDQLDVSSNELRRIARNMMPEALLQLGLEPALKDMCDSVSSDTTPVEFQAFGINTTIPQDTQVNVYRIVQELLTNALRHAEASEILVQCSQNENMFFITLEDNGKGFDVRDMPQGNGIGLTNVRKRVEYLNGKIEIASSAEEGTTINIEFDVTA
ncbi:tetratricopeptide repeat-containing sensor histidine kinase [Chryseolinea lacunae]|uniref:histidine kinase n=1 Tax=Chryseolinea lacunae TaxID=2801331 RepID=A0ABS1KQ06_9BACT|nr:sensor histidine kinase [Chryseolinea lacunae]MBL0741439.1 sensor histidine kinase [Chryseolinea lacunae]